MSRPGVRLADDEIEKISTAMYDLQRMVAEYYASTNGWSTELAHSTPARSALACVQKLHEVLSTRPADGGISDHAGYTRVFESFLDSDDVGAGTVSGMKYLRQVGQHLVDPVRVGGRAKLGTRSYNVWDDVSEEVHAKLRSGTQELRPDFERRLRGVGITDSFLVALEFFARVCPEAAHKTATGEWSCFPLRSQDGVLQRLHPLEPKNESDAIDWLRSRRPGGDLRLVWAQMPLGGTTSLVGLTFRSRRSYLPFVERADVVAADIAAGFPYFTPQAGLKLEQLDDDEGRHFLRAVGGQDPVTAGVEQLTGLPEIAGGHSWLADDHDAARAREMFVCADQNVYDTPDEPFIVYRARRFYAA